MRKTGIILLATVLLCLDFYTHAQIDRTLSNGFSIQLIIGIPPEDYGIEVGAEVASFARYPALFGVKLGNRWYFNNSDQFGIGLMVNWLDASFTKVSFNVSGKKDNWVTLDATLCEFGPIGTYAINADMAIDAYYNLRPTGLFTFSFWEGGAPYGEAYGAGITHGFGAAFRWNVLSIGIESVLGNVRDEVEKDNGNDLDLQVNNFRFVLGVKF